ncbi:MAG: ATP-dependent DNA helicase RecG [Verrucomicrobia bacterium]|nr:ATP-dependent DNA helicase RecG [Verrucomicrobiota bacterium]MBI3867852.1 ATP-dependent DNA helicase RecG [Verrucomicrobiota bacterium]
MSQDGITRLETPLSAFRGVGPDRAFQLRRLGLVTLLDLFLHRPRRYEDRRRLLPIRDLRLDAAATIHGRIRALGVRKLRKGNKSVFEMAVEDGTGRVICRWWNLPFMQNYFRAGEDVFVYGKPTSLKPAAMDHPEVETVDESGEAAVHLNRIVPVYPLTEGLTQRWLRQFLWEKVAAHATEVPDRWPSRCLPGEIPRALAIRHLHCPESLEDAELGRQRLALDEFIALQLELRGRRRRLEAHARGIPCSGDNRWMKPFLRVLGFRLTDGQTEVLREIRHDLGGEHPMRRLLQGDVGCGKTVVAACAALMTLEAGHNAAIMAPTEILAEQHHRNFSRWWEGIPVDIVLRTGSQKGEAKQASGVAKRPRLFVGTHAIIEGGFAMDDLGLVIIDEQHKFGVQQREALLKKGRFPHLLIMTATPIPRTLGLTLYGDLDVSVIRQMPGGRGTLRTHVREARHLPKVWRFVSEELAKGRQAYVVYPRIEDSGKPGLKAVTQEFERIREALRPARVRMMHGRLPADQKQSTIEGFRRGEVDVLLATSVIEVGVDVPNATVMVIESAEQFGLAQLHQLRGRIGRGSHASHCILVGDLRMGDAKERLSILEQTRDGFEIAEADLRFRGPGELIGKEQSGVPDFKFADLRSDLQLVHRARAAADRILDGGQGSLDPSGHRARASTD